MSRRAAFSAVFPALCGASWMLPIPWMGPLLSLAFVGLVLTRRSGPARYLAAFSYYAAGSVGLLRGVDVFFGSHAPVWEGAFLWLGSAALLAAGWAFADRPWKAALVLLLDALVPPLSFFDWLSPLAAAGVSFPGFGWVGLFLLLVLIGTIAGMEGNDRRFPREPRFQEISRSRLVLAAGIVVLSNALAQMHPASPPKGWRGVDLTVGPAIPDILANQTRHMVIIRETLVRAKGASVVLLPETLETDWAGNAWAIQRTVPEGQTWLVGMSVPRKPGFLTDSIVAFRHTGKPRVLFSSAFPVPVSMWHPWHQGHGYVRADGVGYEAAWWTPTRRIEGVRAWASICYDQLLPFIWVEALVQHPQVILLTNNEWWARGTGIPVIQRNTAWAWGRLLGVPEIEAENA
ncbi:MAG: carbon-nitrogen hydrolase family protein [Sulfuriferula sp.]